MTDPRAQAAKRIHGSLPVFTEEYVISLVAKVHATGAHPTRASAKKIDPNLRIMDSRFREITKRWYKATGITPNPKSVGKSKGSRNGVRKPRAATMPVVIAPVATAPTEAERAEIQSRLLAEKRFVGPTPRADEAPPERTWQQILKAEHMTRECRIGVGT